MAGEFALIDKYFARPTPSAVLGPGDDCALLQPTPGMQLAITTDMLVAGTHFLPDTDPRKLGWKALAVNLSDLAAMGATPRWALLAGSLPAVDEAWIARFRRRLLRLRRRIRRRYRRRRHHARPAQSLHHRTRRSASRARRCAATVRRPATWSGFPAAPAWPASAWPICRAESNCPEPWRRLCIAALEKPRPRVALGLALLGIASAAIDVSDGLLADLGHIAERSGLAAAVQLVQLPHLPNGRAAQLRRRPPAPGARMPAGRRRRLRALLHRTPARQANAVSAIAARPRTAALVHRQHGRGHAPARSRFSTRTASRSNSPGEATTTLAESTKGAPSLKFLLAHPAHFLACGCGSGLARWAPGTFGTLFAWLSFNLFQPMFSDFELLWLFDRRLPARHLGHRQDRQGARRPRPRQHRLGRDRSLLAGPAA